MPLFPGNLQFLLGVHSLSQLPPDEGVEVAFAGRSNVGKSSAINAITGRRALARTSKTPGRTQQLNFFAIDEQRRLVDMPGYGYAKVPPEVRRRWQRTVERYLEIRRSLRGLVLLMDIRHPLRPFDMQLLAWCRQSEMPVHVLLTKADKLGKGRGKTVLLEMRKDLGERYPAATVQLFSAAKKQGIEEARAVLEQWLVLEAV